MKIVSMLIVMTVFFSACSQKKALISKAECRVLENEIITLEKEKKMNLASKIGNVLVNGSPQGVDDVKLNQNIKVLKMKLADCNKG